MVNKKKKKLASGVNENDIKFMRKYTMPKKKKNHVN